MSLKAKFIAGTVLLGALAIGGDYVYNNAYSYSRGGRTGNVFKFSEKGRLCKTWEGTMMTDGYGRVGGQGTTASFDFTVMDKNLIPLVEAAKNSGERVDLEYRQVNWRLSCLQDSDYVVTGVNKIDPNGQKVPYIISLPVQNKR